MNRGTMMIVMASVMITLLAVSFIYVGRRINRWLTLVAPDAHPKLIFIGICVIFFASIAASFLPMNMAVKQPLVWFAWFLIGLFIYVLFFFLLSDIVIAALKLLRIVPKPVPSNYIGDSDFTVFALRSIAGYVVFALAGCMVLYGVYNAKQIKHASDTVLITGKKTSLKNLNVVLISDIHLGYLNDEKWLGKLVDKINALEPDVVAMAGDIFNDNFKAFPNPEEGVRVLRGLKSTYGVYACMGNHDVGSTYHDMVRFLEDGGVKVLQDEYVVVEDKFIIVGRKDSRPISYQGNARKDFAFVLDAADTDMPVIVIDHNPANAEEYGSEVDLILTGHTHGGQMFPVIFISPLIYPMYYGHYSKDGKDGNVPHVVVTSGAGLWGPPMRIGTNNEIHSVLVEFD